MPSITLSPAQQQVVAHRGSDLQVVACAGAGKTEAISRRIASLLAEGVEPEAIVAFTFTERAAGELKNRVVERAVEMVGPSVRETIGRMFVGTIHGYCFRLLQDHVPRYGNYDVLDEHRHAGLLSREFYALGLQDLGAKHWATIDEWVRTVDVIGNELVPAATLAGTPVGEVYARYRAMLDRYHLLTFGLIIACAVEALEDPKVKARVTGPLRYLFVDEFQDVNPAQERLIDLLSGEHVELTVVGDDDQAIYQFRGSDVRPIVEFTKNRPGAATITLDENRRSRPGIVARANAFAGTIPGRLAKQMQPVRAAAGHWSEEQTSLEGIVEYAHDWVAFDSSVTLEPGMFVARVTGHSMEPLIPADSYCLFRPVPGGTRQNRKLLVWHEGSTDPETGGEYTVKVYSTVRAPNEDGEFLHTKIVLSPLNPDYEPIELTPEHEGQVRALAEFVEVVGPAPGVSE